MSTARDRRVERPFTGANSVSDKSDDDKLTADNYVFNCDRRKTSIFFSKTAISDSHTHLQMSSSDGSFPCPQAVGTADNICADFHADLLISLNCVADKLRDRRRLAMELSIVVYDDDDDV